MHKMHQNTLDGRAPLGEHMRSPDTLAAMGPTSKGYRRKGRGRSYLHGEISRGELLIRQGACF